MFSQHVFSEITTLDPVIVSEIGDSSSFSTDTFVGNHLTLDREYFEHKFISTSELLSQQSGIEIQSSSGVGQFATPIIRGAQGKQVLVFIDDILINGLSGDNADIGFLNLATMGSVDIYRSIIPMELSPTSIGGAINIKSQNTSQNRGEIGGAIGSYGVRQQYGFQHFNSETTKAFISLESTSAKNDFEYLELSPVSSPNSPKTESRYNNESKNINVMGKVGHQINSDSNISVLARKIKTNREISTVINTPLNKTNISNDSDFLVGSYTHKIYSNSKVKFRWGLNRSEEIYDDRNNRIGLGKQYIQYNSNLQNGNLTFTTEFDDLHLTANHQYYVETTDSKPLNDFSSSLTDCDNNLECDQSIKRQQWASGLRTQWYVNKRLYLIAQAVRLRQLDDAYSDTTAKQSYHDDSYTAGLSYTFYPSLSFNSNFSQQVRPPSTQELFGDRGNAVGNPELKPESSKNIELGIEKKSSNYTVSFNIYYRKTLDNIVAQQDSRGIIKYFNIAETSHKGGEFNFLAHWKNYLVYRGNFTRQIGLIEKHLLSSKEGNLIGDHRTTFINQSIVIKQSIFSFELEHQLEMGGYYDDLNSPELSRDTKKTWNIAVTADTHDVNISFQAKNINDDRTRDFPLTPAIGTTYYLKTSYRW